VAIKDEGNTLFGARVSDDLRKGQGGYYGGGESCAHPLLLNLVVPVDVALSCGYDNSLTVFKWIGKNDDITLCEPESISFGGG
jgi:hypothetical protein